MDEPKKTEMPTTTKVRNLTANRLSIYGHDERPLVLAPFQEIEMSAEQLACFPGIDGLTLGNKVETFVEPPPKVTDIGALIGPLTAPLFFALIMANNVVPDEWKALLWWGGGGVVLIVIGLVILGANIGGTAMMRQLAHLSSLALTVLIGIAIPTVLIGWFGHGSELLIAAFSGAPASLPLLGRCLQLALISCASVLPGLLYYLFDRQQIGTLRARFEQQILHLDPNVTNLVEVRTKYGRQMEEAFGAGADSDSMRLPGGTRWPVMVCITAITLAWTMVLMPFGIPVVDGLSDLPGLLRPRPDAVVFGFLGTYFFALGTILRRYTRGDLRPKAYSSITVRILSVMILSWVLQTLPTAGPETLVIAFLFGILPESAVTYFRESLRQRPAVTSGVSTDQEQHPLTHLEEIDIYDRARLLDEGVTNVEGLAHHDLVDLMLETRIPVPRLVDWIDQAILYLHVSNYSTGREVAGSELEDMRPWLRSLGIRTATDLLSVCETASIEELTKAHPERLHRLRVLRDAIADDEWLDYVHHWRKTRVTEPDEIRLVKTKEEQELVAKPTPTREVDIAAASGGPPPPWFAASRVTSRSRR